MGHRRGKGQILTADQLAERLAIPCYYILQGRANAAFPYTSTPAPSDFVQVILTRPTLRNGDAPYFPVTVHWRQWRDVIVPLLEDNTWRNYQGSTGGETSLTNSTIPTTPLGPGGLFEDAVTRFISLLGEAIRQGAVDGGWGSPDQA